MASQQLETRVHAPLGKMVKLKDQLSALEAYYHFAEDQWPNTGIENPLNPVQDIHHAPLEGNVLKTFHFLLGDIS